MIDFFCDVGPQGHRLGLLLLAMDGTIEVDSVEGSGCTFTVTLTKRAAS